MMKNTDVESYTSHMDIGNRQLLDSSRGGGVSPKQLSQSSLDNHQGDTQEGIVAVILPCYNEEKTIAQVIDEVFAVLPNAHIYVFDNNSNDNSQNIVKAKITEINALRASNLESQSTDSKPLDSKIPTKSLTLHSVSTQGKGAVMREAFALIEADFYIMIDADTEHDASILPQALAYFSTHKLDMLNIAREADSSTYRKGHSFGNKLFSKSTQMLFGTKINDMLSGYRIFSRPFVKSFPAHSNGFEIETELTIYALEQRLRTDEIKAPYKSRPEGSFSKLSTFKDGFKILLMILNLLFSERPLLVFGVLSAICFLLSLFFGVPVFVEFLETSKVARFPTLFVCVGLMVIAVVLFIAGLLAHLVTKSIKESRYLAYLQSKRESYKGIYGE